MNIVIEYDSSVSNAPAGFEAAVEAAVNYFDSLISNPITVPIMFSYGELQGQALGSGTLGESSTNGNIETYASVKAFLTAAATSNADFQSLATLPATDPTNGGRFWISDAEAQAFGLGSEAGYSDPEDGFVALSSSSNFTFDPNNRAVSGEYDAIGVAEHEISEALGRISYLGTGTFEGYSLYSALDLFRYSSSGVHSLTYAAGYFSVDGQNMLDAYNDPSNGGDAGDWASSVTNDAFDAFSQLGVKGVISSDDMLELDLLGFQINTGATSTVPGGDTISATAGDTIIDTSNSDTFTGGGYGVVLGVSNLTSFDAANGLVVSDASGVGGDNLVLDANNLNFTDDAAGGLGVYEAAGVTSGTVWLSANGLVLIDGANDLTIADGSGVSGGAVVLVASNLTTFDDASGLSVSDASGITGGNIVLGASNLGLVDTAGGGIGVYDANGVTGGTVTLGANSLLLFDGANDLTIADGSGGSGGAVVLVASNLTTFDDASGLSVSDASGVTGGNIVLGTNNIGLVDAASGTLGVYDAGGVSGGTVTLGASGQTLVAGTSGLTLIGSNQGRDIFVGSSSQLNSDTIKNFAASGDVLDLSDMSSSYLTTATFAENAGGTAGTLTLSDGPHSSTIVLFGQFMAAGFSGSAASAGFSTAFDGTAGTNVTYVAVPH